MDKIDLCKGAINIEAQKQKEDFILFLNELREEMSKRGLTQEILDDILKDES